MSGDNALFSSQPSAMSICFFYQPYWTSRNRNRRRWGQGAPYQLGEVLGQPLRQLIVSQHHSFLGVAGLLVPSWYFPSALVW